MSDIPGLVFLKDMETGKKQPGFFRLYGKLLLLLFLVVAGAASFFLITRGALSYRFAHLEYERIRQTHVRIAEGAYESDPEVEPDGKEETRYPSRPSGAVLEIDFAALTNVNPDTVAWLHVPALQISYPVVYRADRDYYTKHTFEGTYNANGAIFVEPFNRPDFNDPNTFLYGHNSADGSMFGTLHELAWLDAEREKNPCVFLYLKDGGIRKYRIYSYYVTKEDSASFRIIDEASYDGYAEYTKQCAQREIAAPFQGHPGLVTLSACYGEAGTDERFLVHAVRVP